MNSDDETKKVIEVISVADRTETSFVRLTCPLSVPDPVTSESLSPVHSLRLCGLERVTQWRVGVSTSYGPSNFGSPFIGVPMAWVI
jgi:hypothetical protein